MRNTTQPTLSDALGVAFAAQAAGFRVAFTARVDSYDRQAGTVDVTPCAKVPRPLRDGSVAWETIPPLAGVRVAWPSGGGVVMTFPIAAGDLLTCEVRDTSHAEVDAGVTEYPITPRSSRRFSPADCVARPGYTTDETAFPAAASSDEDPVIYMPNGVELRIGAGTANKALALAEKVNTELQEIQTAFSAHTHSISVAVTGTANLITGAVVGTAAGTSGAAPTYTATDVASTRVFSDG